MQLTFKHIAIFGQVKVDMSCLDSNLPSYTTLLDLYKDGWWVTDRFGTIITIVKPRKYNKDGFRCLCRRITTNVNLNTLDLLTKQIADEKYETYKNYLQSKKGCAKIKKTKEYLHENHLSTLSPRNSNKYGHILRKTQGTDTRKIQGKL